MKADLNNNPKYNYSHLNHGNNQVGVRNYNERLILQLVRNHGKITKAEATRATGLSPNAISVIFKSLEKDKLIIKGEAIRGKIGQPSMPMSLNPTCMYFFGLKIGRRSYELILMDFVGNIIISFEQQHKLPRPEDAIHFAKQKLEEALKITKISQNKIGGLGVATPYELWKWSDSDEQPEGDMRAWENFDLKQALENLGNWPVFIENDATAACGAELVFGEHKDKQNFVYLFIGTLIGGGIVLNGSVFKGQSGTAGGYGPMPIPAKDGKYNKLADHASLYVLESMLTKAGIDPKLIYDINTDWAQFGNLADKWIKQTSQSLAYAIIATLSIIDFQAIIIDGSIPQNIKQRITKAVIQEIIDLKVNTIAIPPIFPGSYGEVARAMGAASLPLRDKYLLNQNTLLRH